MRRICTPLFVLTLSAVGAAAFGEGETPADRYEAAPVVLPGAETDGDPVAVDPGTSVGGLFIQVAAMEGVRPSLMGAPEVWEEEDLLQVQEEDIIPGQEEDPPRVQEEDISLLRILLVCVTLCVREDNPQRVKP